MSIASQLTALQTDITNARTQITTMGGTVTVSGGSSQLATDISTIPTGGSGDLPIGSTITVTSNEGATIEIERGTESQTLVVPSSGSVSFTVHQSGIWNLTANKTGETELTDSVVVSADDTTYTKQMFWIRYLYNQGDVCSSVTGGYSAIGVKLGNENEKVPTITYNADNIYEVLGTATGYWYAGRLDTVNKIDLTAFNYLHIKVNSVIIPGSTYAGIGVYSAHTDTSHSASYTDMTAQSSSHEFLLDVSSYSGEYYVGCYITTSGNGSASITISQIWLS